MIKEERKTKIKAFISRFFQNYNLSDDEDIFALGFVNSLFAMQLVLFLEKEFSIKIENEDLDLDNFRTVDAMILLVERKSTSSTVDI